MRQISAAEANREFSKLLRDVRGGETITVTSHGEPVALIAPVRQGADPVRSEARRALTARLRQQPASGINWTRDELYDR